MKTSQVKIFMLYYLLGIACVVYVPPGVESR